MSKCMCAGITQLVYVDMIVGETKLSLLLKIVLCFIMFIITNVLGPQI